MTKFTEKEIGQMGLLNYVEFENGRNAALLPFIFTFAIVTDITTEGYRERYCYHDATDCRGALKDWNGEGHPEGWHRHMSPRKPDRRVHKGVMYWGDADPDVLKNSYGETIPDAFTFKDWQDDDPTDYLKINR